MNRRILYWGDAPTVSTGFGVIAKHVLRALFDVGIEVDCLATNTPPDFPDRARFPYAVVPVSGSAQDPFGCRTLARLVSSSQKYELLFVQNDLQVAHTAAGYLHHLRQRGVALPPIIYYYPVDCSVRPDLRGMVELADVIVTCTNFGRDATGGAPGRRTPLVIPYGVDGGAFHPLEDVPAVRSRFRRAHGIPDDAIVICSVAANSVRKDLARAIAAFARFRAASSRAAVFYLHTMPIQNGIDLNQAASACGLTVGRDVIFPRDYHPLQGGTDADMNEIYNASDLYFTTTLGEGWGLPITEAMAAGLLVVGPRNSSLVEIAGEGRAVLYECTESVWVDNAGYRPFGRMEDILKALYYALALPEGERRQTIRAARDFAATVDWSVVTPRWVALVRDLLTRESGPPSRS